MHNVYFDDSFAYFITLPLLLHQDWTFFHSDILLILEFEYRWYQIKFSCMEFVDLPMNPVS